MSNLLREARVLLVDDDPVMRELAGARLVAAGYEVGIAENGAGALEMLEKQGADLVISDLDMPVMNGFELTRNIRRSTRYSELPVIVITASDHSEAVEEAFAAGATSFVAKPINWALFSHAILFVMKANRDHIELRTARDRAEAGARFKDTLMSIMSHELRTPLNAIIGFGQLLYEQFEREDDHLHREYAEYIVDGGKRLLNSVSDMLLASEARSDPITLNEVDCTIGEIVELSVAAMSKFAALAEADISLVSPIRQQEICCDRQLVARAVSKLIDNAVKFSQRGVKITVGAIRLDDGRLAFLVKDNGPGISTGKLASLRQPFEQLDMSLRRSKEGLGLGLPLVQAIAVAHGGEFRLTSTPGEGTQALLLLPESRFSGAPASRTQRKRGAA